MIIRSLCVGKGLDYSAQPPNAGSGVRQQNGTSAALPPASHVWLPLGTPRHCPTNAVSAEPPLPPLRPHPMLPLAL